MYGYIRNDLCFEIRSIRPGHLIGAGHPMQPVCALSKIERVLAVLNKYILNNYICMTNNISGVNNFCCCYFSQFWYFLSLEGISIYQWLSTDQLSIASLS